MNNKRIIKMSLGLLGVVVVGTLGLSIFYDSAFIPSFMLMLALLLFVICYQIKDNKKTLSYIIFAAVVLLIIGSLVYTFLRLN